MEPAKILVIGNSDGIGLETTRRLLEAGWKVIGLSRSASSIVHDDYEHRAVDVLTPEYLVTLREIVEHEEDLETCLFCVGVGNEIEDEFWRGESKTVATNFLSVVQTLEILLPRWLAKGKGHFIGLSSLVDVLRVPDGCSYSGSKAGMSNYLESLGLRIRKQGVFISNVRFGFVDTKMAQSPVKPAMIEATAAAKILMKVLQKKPIRLSRPRRILPALSFLSFLSWLQVIRY